MDPEEIKNQSTPDAQVSAAEETEEKFNPNWASDAPRGGRAVLARILKESGTVPLFFAQTLVQSLRDVGYNTTTSALCEHVDNAIEAGATVVRIYFRQTGRRGAHETDILVYDKGKGMAPNVLKVATSFGGSMSYGNRKGIGRFGMGMKSSSLGSPTPSRRQTEKSSSMLALVTPIERLPVATPRRRARSGSDSRGCGTN